MAHFLPCSTLSEAQTPLLQIEARSIPPVAISSQLKLGSGLCLINGDMLHASSAHRLKSLGTQAQKPQAPARGAKAELTSQKHHAQRSCLALQMNRQYQQSGHCWGPLLQRMSNCILMDVPLPSGIVEYSCLGVHMTTAQLLLMTVQPG